MTTRGRPVSRLKIRSLGVARFSRLVPEFLPILLDDCSDNLLGVNAASLPDMIDNRATINLPTTKNRQIRNFLLQALHNGTDIGETSIEKRVSIGSNR